MVVSSRMGFTNMMGNGYSPVSCRRLHRLTLRLRRRRSLQQRLKTPRLYSGRLSVSSTTSGDCGCEIGGYGDFWQPEQWRSMMLVDIW
uniref:Uncharacterized protein n=1 Tax=Helianthus annuus TaxID=4232 RepID=A0A251RY69_HELAN